MVLSMDLILYLYQNVVYQLLFVLRQMEVKQIPLIALVGHLSARQLLVANVLLLLISALLVLYLVM